MKDWVDRAAAQPMAVVAAVVVVAVVVMNDSGFLKYL